MEQTLKDNLDDEENISKNNFRGYIQAGQNTYYIINEIISGNDSLLFSAVKFVQDKNTEEKVVEDQRYCIKYISKDWIRREIFTRLRFSESKINKYFENLKNSYNDFKRIKSKTIQELKDYIEDDKGIYIVVEYCEYILKDYVEILTEPIRNSNIPSEIKLRNLIIQILETVYTIHEKYSLTFGGSLNIYDIMINENYKKNAENSVTVKFPHPFISHILTVLNIYNTESFPSHYAPEVYKLFEEDSSKHTIEKKTEFDLGSVLNKINQNFDMWALGYLLFEILYGNPPFIFNSLSNALYSLNDKFTYKVNPYYISSIMLKFINTCLQLEPQERMQSYNLQDLIEELTRELSNLEEFEKMMRNRATKADQIKESQKLNLIGLSYKKFTG